MTSLLDVNNVTIRIGAKTVCQQATLSFRRGEIWGILGPNGSGKTTFLHALAGLWPTAHGTIQLQQHLLLDLSLRDIAQQLALLFQDFSDTFPQTVWEYCLSARYPHVSYFKRAGAEDKEIVARALEIMDLSAFSQRNVMQLSGGEKRRVAIAAILAQTPAIYLLDEPTNQLDIRHQRLTLQHLQQLATTKAAAIVMSLHDVNVAQQFCQHIVMLFPDGELRHGRVKDMLTEDNLTRLYECPMKALRDNTGVFWLPLD